MEDPTLALAGPEDMRMVLAEDIRSKEAQLRRLSVEISQLIDKYRILDDEPPFSAAEMVAMACVCICTEQPSANKSEILQWILMNFKYYNALAVQHYVITQCSDEDNEIPNPTAVIQDFREAFNLWYLPVIPADGAVEDSVVYTREGDNEIEMVIPAGAARIFLEPWLGKARKGTFPFLKLPPELRNRVYEMALSYSPDGGIYYQGPGRLYLLNRPEDTVLQSRDDFGDLDDEALPFNARENHVLALLKTSKQVAAETKLLFYKLNCLCGDDLSSTINLFNTLGPDRYKYICNLRLDLWYVCINGMSGFRGLMDAMAAVCQPRSLKLVARDGEWIGMGISCRRMLGRRAPIKTVDQIPGFKALALLCSKAGSLTFINDDGTEIERWLRAEVGKIKAQKSTAGKVERVDKGCRAKRRGKKSEVDESTGKRDLKKVQKA